MGGWSLMLDATFFWQCSTDPSVDGQGPCRKKGWLYPPISVAFHVPAHCSFHTVLPWNQLGSSPQFICRSLLKFFICQIYQSSQKAEVLLCRLYDDICALFPVLILTPGNLKLLTLSISIPLMKNASLISGFFLQSIIIFIFADVEWVCWRGTAQPDF